jgi:glyoxylase-like metal-dependent hydrolase (beta-lactamase superfamily II)
MFHADRRTVLKAALGGAAALTAPAFAGRALAQSASATAIGDGLSLFNIGGANVLVLSASDGAVLVDTGPAAAADALMAALDGQPVATVFNTQYHADQTGNNATLRRAGANIVAHKRTHQWMAHPFWVPGEMRYEAAREEDALPTETFLTTGDRTAGGQRIEYGYLLEAHTSGDIYVWFRDANVLAVGDVASPERDIAIDWYTGAWTGARLDAMRQLIDMIDDQTQIVPAFGPAMTRADFQAEHDMLLALHDAMVVKMRSGYSYDDMAAEGLMDVSGRAWAEPDKFLYDACKGLWGHQNALSPDIV